MGCSRASASKKRESSEWYVQYEERNLLLLKNPRFIDMFWCEYEVELLTDMEEDVLLINTPDFWWSGKIIYRSVACPGIIASNAFPGGDVADILRNHRVSMRALYAADVKGARFLMGESAFRLLWRLVVIGAMLAGFFGHILWE